MSKTSFFCLLSNMIFFFRGISISRLELESRYSFLGVPDGLSPLLHFSLLLVVGGLFLTGIKEFMNE
jgi:hypothetical protein